MQRSNDFRDLFCIGRTPVELLSTLLVQEQVADLFKLGSPALVGFERIADKAGEAHHATRTGEMIEHNMPRRTTTAELRDRLDGLALAFFAVTGAFLDVVAELHPNGRDAWEEMRADAFGLILTLEEVDQDVFPQAAINQAFIGLMAAFASRVGEEDAGAPEGETEGDNDNVAG